MDVTRRCALTMRPAIREALRRCEFVAVDLEFTGIDTGRGVDHMAREPPLPPLISRGDE